MSNPKKLVLDPKALAKAGLSVKGMRPIAARTRHEPGVMNKTELSYSQHLELQRRLGSVVWFDFEPLKLKLAPNDFYNIDFMVQFADGIIEMVDVKGTMKAIEGDALEKMKNAANKFFMFRFIIAYPHKKSWKRIEYPSAYNPSAYDVDLDRLKQELDKELEA